MDVLALGCHSRIQSVAMNSCSHRVPWVILCLQYRSTATGIVLTVMGILTCLPALLVLLSFAQLKSSVQGKGVQLKTNEVNTL